MNTRTVKITSALALALGCLAAWAAHAEERIVVPLTDAARPVVLEVDTIRTSINVTAYDGKEIVIVARESTAKEGDDDREQRGPRGRAGKDEDGSSTAGLRRIPNSSVGLTASEDNNVVSVKTDFSRQPLALDISVPRTTSVRAKTVNGGDLALTGVAGEHELSNVNGRIVAKDIAGSLVANTTNGSIRATFTEVTAGKAMSFNTFNGDVDVTFPAKLAATLRVTSGRGDFYTDFDVAMQQQAPEVTQGGQNGRYEVRLERETVAVVGRGGPDIRFKTFNGNVMIRKR